MGVVTKEKGQDLPRDVDALIALIQSRDVTIASRDERIDALEHNLAVFARMLFGKSSEKREFTGMAAGHPGQHHLFLADLVADAERIAEETGVVGHVEVERPDPAKQPKRKGRRKKFPDHLPSVETLFELPEDQRRCDCGGKLHPMGFEESRELERLEITIVHKIKRAKYGCRECTDGVTTAPGPSRVIEKGMLGAGFLAHIICERFQFHMPYYRLEKKYASEGMDISRSVLERSVASCAARLKPLHTALREAIMSEDIVWTDDTTVTLVNPKGAGGSAKGRVWIYLDKPGRHYYDFTETREAKWPLEVFEGYEGFAQADAYPGYDALYASGKVIEVACWAHTRRKFESVASTDPDLSAEALALIGELYAIESKAREKKLDPKGIAALRAAHATPVLGRIDAWLAVTEAKVLRKSPMWKAVYYARAQWKALIVYVTDGRLDIDNNAAERAMRPIAVGRKNWLFYQTKGGGESACILMSLIRTAEAAGVNVKLYFRDVLQRIDTESDVKKLLPHEWKKHFEAEVLGRRNDILDLLLVDQNQA